MTHRVIVSMAAALAVCFWLLGYLDPQLFGVHLYESLIYVAIAALLIRFKDRWAYMLGMLGPAAWLVLILMPAVWTLVSFAVGSPTGILRTVLLIFWLRRPSVAATILEVATLVLSISLILVCLSRWRTNPAARLQIRSTFLVCLTVVAVYYGVLIVWLLRWKPVAA